MTRFLTPSKVDFGAIVLILFALSVPTTTHGANKSIVSVADVEALYTAVNDPGNGEWTVQLAPGIYTLSARDPNGAPRPNGGRLELQMGMSLIGVVGDRSAVVIDASGLPASTFQDPITGVIRVGRGLNVVEWLTVNGHAEATGSIETDLIWPKGPSRVRVAHVVSTNSHRGIDVRNIGVDMANRVVEIDIIDTDVSGGLEGFRMTNQNNSSGAVIRVRMSDNFSHGNEIGCIVTNARTSTGTISVKSERDTFSDNGLGCMVSGGLIQGANVANSNYVSFEARGSKFINNNGPIFLEGGGLVLAGASSGLAGATSNNSIDVRLSGCQIYGNQIVNFRAFGSRSGSGSLGGTNNHANVTLRGTSRTLKLDAINSFPEDPARTNTVTVVRKTIPFDFDGDGKTDIGIVRGAIPNVQWWVEKSSDRQAYVTNFGSAAHPSSFDRPAPADFDGDGRTDIAIYKDGVWWWINSGDGTLGIVPFGVPKDTPVPADYTGDGRDELAVFRGGQWWTYDLDDAQISVINFGTQSDFPVPGDFDGDGKIDQAVRREPFAEWWIKKSSGGHYSLRFGSSLDWPMVGDYDGDGKSDLAFYRYSDGKWYLQQSTAGYAEVRFGGDDFDFPIPGDYDGDGRTDIAIYRSGLWYLLQSSDGISYRPFGGYEWDEPIPAAFLNRPFIP
jgi:hypothetical protein